MQSFHRVTAFIISIFLSFLSFPAHATKTFGDFETTGAAFVLYNANEHKILASENPDEKLPIASLTKLMVATVILENSNLTLENEITITPVMLEALAGWSIVGLQPGQTATVEDLLYALLLPSAGDAGQALAIADSGSIDAFAEKMNQKAAELNLKNSHFTNPIGRDEDNYSTVSDLATLLFHSLENSTFKTIFSATEYDFKPLGKAIEKTTTTYGLDTSILTGSKTGYTPAAGRCLASTTTLNGVDYLYVTLGHDPATANHIEDTLAMYNYFNDHYSYRSILEQDQLLLELPVTDAKIDTYELKAPETVAYYLENAYDLSELDISITHPNTINRYTDLATPLAHLTIKKDSEIIYETNLSINSRLEFNDHLPLIITLVVILTILLMLALLLPRRRLSKFGTPLKIILAIVFIATLASSTIYLTDLYHLPTPETITTPISLE